MLLTAKTVSTTLLRTIILFRLTTLISQYISPINCQSTNSRWTEIKYTNVIPPSRWGTAGAFISQTNEFLVWGGVDYTGHNDMYSINLTSFESSLIFATTPVPKRNYYAHTSDLSTGDFYVHGGIGSGTFNPSYFLFLISCITYFLLFEVQ